MIILVLNETTLLLDSKEFNMTWLRDQCECEYCFDPEEKIKLFHIFSVSHKVSEEYDISLTGNQLKVMCKYEYRIYSLLFKRICNFRL